MIGATVTLGVLSTGVIWARPDATAAASVSGAASSKTRRSQKQQQYHKEGKRFYHQKNLITESGKQEYAE
jgi:hypothetical protein